MRSLVLAEFPWGDTEQAVHVIAAGMGDAPAVQVVAVEVVEAGVAPAAPPEQMDLLVAGGPTHTFSLSRPDTRPEAVTPPAVTDSLSHDAWIRGDWVRSSCPSIRSGTAADPVEEPQGTGQ